MPKTFAALLDDIESELQDTGNVLWDTTELSLQMEKALREISEYQPYVRMETFEFETRTGTDTAGTADKLTDTTETQFRTTGELGKVVLNTTERTLAIVTAMTSTSVFTLSKDIMNSGDDYIIFNEECRSKYEIYLGDVLDYIGDDHGVERVEFPVGLNPPALRNFHVDGDILTVDLTRSIPDSKSADLRGRVVEVGIWIKRRHQVTQLTDVSGELTATASAGATSIAVDGLVPTTGVVDEDTELRFVGTALERSRGIHRVTNSGGVTLSGGAGTLTIFPPLESALADNDDVSFLVSSLTRRLERIVVQLTAARAADSKGMKLLQQSDTAISNMSNVASALGQSMGRIMKQLADLKSGRTELVKTVTLVSTTANTEIGLINAQIDLAVTDLASGRTQAGKAPALLVNAASQISNLQSQLRLAATAVAAGKTAADLAPAVILEANAEIDKMATELTKATATLDQARAGIRRVNIGAFDLPGQAGTVAGHDMGTARTRLETARGFLEQAGAETPLADSLANNALAGLGVVQGHLDSARAYIEQAQGEDAGAQAYATLAQGEVATATGFLASARGYLEQAAADESIAKSYIDLGAGELAGAVENVNEGLAYLQQVATNLAIADRTGEFTRWGNERADTILRDLRRQLPVRVRRKYPSD